MQEQEIIRYLRLLGEELEVLQVEQPVRLLLVGGAYMVTQIGNRATTMDVDVVAHVDPESQEYLSFKNAVRFVASDMHISLSWLSDNIGEFIAETQHIPLKQPWLKHGMLEVYLPDPQYILVLKIIAARENDIEDARALLSRLRLKNRKQVERVLRKYGNRNMLADYTEEIEISLSALFGK